MKAAIYCRVSTGSQEEDGTSLDSQSEACLKKAQELGFDVPSEYVFHEVWSGIDLDRPGLDMVRSLVKYKGVQAVVCYATDRLARKAVHIAILAEEWERHGASLVFVTEPLDSSPEGQLIRYVRGYAAEIEREKIRERTMRGKKARALQGKLPAGNQVRLYGYEYDKKNGVRVVDEDQAFWVRQMFKWVAEGWSANKVVFKLRELGVPTPGGAPFWGSSTVRKILRNRAYVGETYAFTSTYVEPIYRSKPNAKRRKSRIVWKPKEEWVEIPGATPAIVSRELFDAVQSRLMRNKELSLRNAKRQYLLRGHIFCGECGHRYVGITDVGRVRRKGGGRYERRLYRCSSWYKIHAPVPCKNRSVNADEVERLVWEEVEKVLSQPQLVFRELERRQEMAESCEYWQDQIEQVEMRIKDLMKRQQRLLRAFTFGFDEQIWRAENAAINGEKTLRLEEKAFLEKQLKTTQELHQIDVEGVKRLCNQLRQELSGCSFEDKRQVLDILQIKVAVNREGISVHGTLPVPVFENMLSGWREQGRDLFELPF